MIVVRVPVLQKGGRVNNCSTCGGRGRVRVQQDFAVEENAARVTESQIFQTHVKFVEELVL